SFLTVFVVSQPDSGLVLTKRFYRILGTIAGLFVTTALVFALAQYGELFVFAVAIWISFCNFAARAARNFASYGFQLAGYTVAIVGIPAALQPDGAYPLVVARFTEIMLGIICAALVSRLFFVRELSPNLVELVRSLTRRADRLVTALLDPDADRVRVAEERNALINDYVTALAMQQSAYFESAEARILAQPLRRLTQGAVELCATAEAVASHRTPSKLDTQSVPRPVESLETSHSPSENEARLTAFVRAADDRDIRFARTRLSDSMAAFDRGDQLPEPATTCRLWSDPVPAALTGIRSALAVLITSVFWFATAWPNGPAAVIVAAVACTLLASGEQPEKITMAAAATVLIAAVPVFVTQFYLLPLAVDFPSMAVALAPLTLTCAFIIAQPRIGPLGLLSAVYFAFASNINNVVTYDAAGFLNTSFAILLGIAVAVVLFATFFPETPTYASRRFRRQLFVHLGDIISAKPYTPALRYYQLALCEQLGTTLTRVKDEPKIAAACFANAATGLSAAHAINRLKSSHDAAAAAPEVVAEASALLGRLVRAVQTQSALKFRKIAEEAHSLCRYALDAVTAVQGSAAPHGVDALNTLVVGSETLGFSLTRA
ncbi:MAG: FUSC family protein, partial [Pseudolabrys sp.]